MMAVATAYALMVGIALACGLLYALVVLIYVRVTQ